MLRIRPIERPNRITHTPCGSCSKKKAEQLNYNPFGLTYIDSASTGTSQLCSMPRIGWGSHVHDSICILLQLQLRDLPRRATL